MVKYVENCLHYYLHTQDLHMTKEWLYQYYKVIRVFVCMYVCMYVCVSLNNSGTAGPIWLNFFLLAPSWSRDGFRPKKFRIRDPVFPEIRKNPVFRVLFDQFG